MSSFTVQDGDDPYHGFGTLAIHAGQEPDPQTGAVVPPISLATTFAQESPGVKHGVEHLSSFGKGYEYSRTGNPTRGSFERALAAVEHAEFAVAFASGLAATSALVHLLETGDHVVCVDDVYGGTQRYFRRIVKPTYGIDFTFVDFNDQSAFLSAFTSRTKLVWLETPTNPTLKIADIAATAAVARAHGALFVVDNTFLSPYFQNPLDHGADIVVHSVTKYIGGHSDVVGGVVCTSNRDVHEKLRFVQNGMGAVPSPFDCYMALRGLKTLHVRLEAAAKNATAIAKYLSTHPGVTKVIYPGLPSHPQYEIAQRQQHGPGAMITFYLKGDLTHSQRFLENLKLFILAESLGAVESLAECPAVMTHASVPVEVRQELGIDDTLIRLSVGIEALPDLLKDLEGALQAATTFAATTTLFVKMMLGRRYVSGAGELVQYVDSDKAESWESPSCSGRGKPSKRKGSLDDDGAYLVDLIFKAIFAFLVITSIIYMGKHAAMKGIIRTRVGHRSSHHHKHHQPPSSKTSSSSFAMPHHRNKGDATSHQLHETYRHHHRHSPPRAVPAETFNAYRTALMAASQMTRDQLVNLPADVVSYLSAQELREVVSRFEGSHGKTDIYAIISQVINQDAP